MPPWARRTMSASSQDDASSCVHAPSSAAASASSVCVPMRAARTADRCWHACAPRSSTAERATGEKSSKPYTRMMARTEGLGRTGARGGRCELCPLQSPSGAGRHELKYLLHCPSNPGM